MPRSTKQRESGASNRREEIAADSAAHLLIRYGDLILHRPVDNRFSARQFCSRVWREAVLHRRERRAIRASVALISRLAPQFQ